MRPEGPTLHPRLGAPVQARVISNPLAQPRALLALAVAGAGAVAAAAALSASLGDLDDGDRLASLSSALGRLGHVPALASASPAGWLGGGVVVVLTVAHFLLATVVLRAAAGRGVVPLRAGVLSQLAAAAANRLTFVGVGAATVNVRFLFRRGLPVAGAAGTIALVALLGAVADLLLGVLLWAVGGMLGLPGGGAELTRLAAAVRRVAALLGGASPWSLAAIVAVGLVVGLVVRRVRSRTPGDGPGVLRTAWGRAGDLAKRPRDVALLLVASAGTTTVLAVAMLVSVRTVDSGSGAHAGAVLMAYLVGAAAGSAVPVPGGVATTEAALASALVTAGVSVGHAVAAVALYRSVTFWAPIPVGLAAARALRRRRLL